MYSQGCCSGLPCSFPCYISQSLCPPSWNSPRACAHPLSHLQITWLAPLHLQVICHPWDIFCPVTPSPPSVHTLPWSWMVVLSFKECYNHDLCLNQLDCEVLEHQVSLSSQPLEQCLVLSVHCNICWTNQRSINDVILHTDFWRDRCTNLTYIHKCESVSPAQIQVWQNWWVMMPYKKDAN